MDSTSKREKAENSMLKQFKEDLKEHLSEEHNDAVILKWLRAKNFVLEEAELLFRKSLATKTVYETERITEIYQPMEVIKKYSFTGFLGFEKDGTPLRYIALGRGDYMGFIMSMSAYDMFYYGMWIIESDRKEMKRHNETYGTQANEISFICDLEGFTLQKAAHRPVVELAWEIGRIVQDYYPEIWKRIYVINAPSYFHIIYNLIKPIFKWTLLEKIKFVTNDSLTDVFLKHIDPEVLPAFLGGKRVDSNGDPYCSEFLMFGGKIPEDYYIRNTFQLSPEESGVECASIRPGSLYNYSVIVREAGSKLHLQIRPEGGPLIATMLYKKFAPDSEKTCLPTSDEILNENDPNSGLYLISPELKWHIHLAPADALCFCPWPGIYIFRFDNRFTWLQSKKLIFRIKVIPPNKEMKQITYKFPF